MTQAKSENENSTLTIEIGTHHFPYLAQSHTIDVTTMDIFVQTFEGDLLGNVPFTLLGEQEGNFVEIMPAEVQIPQVVQLQFAPDFEVEKVKDLLMIVTYGLK